MRADPRAAARTERRGDRAPRTAARTTAGARTGRRRASPRPSQRVGRARDSAKTGMGEAVSLTMGRGPLSKRPEGRFNFELEPPGAALLSHPPRTASGAAGGEAADAVVALTAE